MQVRQNLKINKTKNTHQNYCQRKYSAYKCMIYNSNNHIINNISKVKDGDSQDTDYCVFSQNFSEFCHLIHTKIFQLN